MNFSGEELAEARKSLASPMSVPTDDLVRERAETAAQPQADAQQRDESKSPETAEACPACTTPVAHAPGIGPYCPNKECGRADDLRPATAAPTPADPAALPEGWTWDDDVVRGDGGATHEVKLEPWPDDSVSVYIGGTECCRIPVAALRALLSLPAAIGRVGGDK